MRTSDSFDPSRRRLLAAGAALVALPLEANSATVPTASIVRTIARSGEAIPVIGMGTWLTFDIGSSGFEFARRRQVLEAFFAAGGRLIDSSPMYGRAETVVGELLPQIPSSTSVFAATKVWTSGRTSGIRQISDSMRLWRRPVLDLEQIHNMVDWETHLATLKQWKSEGRIRYIGITTSHGRHQQAMAAALSREDFDFVQVSYSFADRSAEARLLPLAAERRTAVIINRPFDGGALVDRLEGRRLPGWAVDIGCTSWAQVCLKWIVSHPAVTCTIPATTNPLHMVDNMGALRGPLPDAALRRRIADEVSGV